MIMKNYNVIILQMSLPLEHNSVMKNISCFQFRGNNFAMQIMYLASPVAPLFTASHSLIPEHNGWELLPHNPRTHRRAFFFFWIPDPGEVTMQLNA